METHPAPTEALIDEQPLLLTRLEMEATALEVEAARQFPWEIAVAAAIVAASLVAYVWVIAR